MSAIIRASSMILPQNEVSQSENSKIMIDLFSTDQRKRHGKAFSKYVPRFDRFNAFFLSNKKSAAAVILYAIRDFCEPN
uniref:Transposase n=1 Tax=Caenorhabditis tropicalis TaxID=1561998 RepID=A0A1I7UVH1_9PELO